VLAPTALAPEPTSADTVPAEWAPTVSVGEAVPKSLHRACSSRQEEAPEQEARLPEAPPPLAGLPLDEGSEQGAKVFLNIYDVSQDTGIQRLNLVLAHRFSPFKFGGVFHAGVEVAGREYSYGYCQSGSGVSYIEPRKHPQHHYRETVELAATKLSEQEINRTIVALARQYIGQDYHLMRRNCCHFADELCQALGAGELPGWVYRLARIGDKVCFLSEGLEGLVRDTHMSRSVNDTTTTTAMDGLFSGLRSLQANF